MLNLLHIGKWDLPPPDLGCTSFQHLHIICFLAFPYLLAQALPGSYCSFISLKERSFHIVENAIQKPRSEHTRSSHCPWNAIASRLSHQAREIFICLSVCLSVHLSIHHPSTIAHKHLYLFVYQPLYIKYHAFTMIAPITVQYCKADSLAFGFPIFGSAFSQYGEFWFSLLFVHSSYI